MTDIFLSQRERVAGKQFSAEEWILLQVTHTALAVNVGPLCDVIAAVESAIRSREQSD